MELTPAGNPYTSVKAALGTIPKRLQVVGQEFYVKITGDIHKYTFDKSGKPIPYTIDTEVKELFDTVEVLQERELWLEDLRQVGDTDFQVWQRGVSVMESSNRTLNVGNRTYRFGDNETINLSSYYNIVGHGTVIQYAGGYGRIDTDTEPDLSYPTEKDPGPMKGCAFYITGLSYYPRMEGMEFQSFRFCVSVINTPNSPTFKNCRFNYSNVGVVCYQGSQNFQFVGSDAVRTGTMFMGASTCFPEDSPYSGRDNEFVDGLTIKTEDSHVAFGTEVQPAFDDWFVASFLRPDTPCFGTEKGTLYPWKRFWNPTGRVAYIPFRASTRNCYGLMVRDIDLIGGNPRGLILVNTGLFNLSITGRIGDECVYPEGQDCPFIQLGSVNNGVISAVFNSMGSAADFVRFSGRGNGGRWEKVAPMNGWRTGDYFIDKNWLNKPDADKVAGKTTGADNYGQGHIDLDLSGKEYTSEELVKRLDTATLYIGGGRKQNIPLKGIGYESRGKYGVRLFTTVAGIIEEYLPIMVTLD